MYRAVTLYCLRKGYAGKGDLKISGILADIKDIDMCFVYNPDIQEYETFLNSENVEREIRGFEVSSHVSRISQIPEVSFHACGLVGKTGRRGNFRNALGNAGQIFFALLGYPAQGGSLGLGFQNADRLSIYKEKIVSET